MGAVAVIDAAMAYVTPLHKPTETSDESTLIDARLELLIDKMS